MYMLKLEYDSNGIIVFRMVGIDLEATFHQL